MSLSPAGFSEFLGHLGAHIKCVRVGCVKFEMEAPAGNLIGPGAPHQKLEALSAAPGARGMRRPIEGEADVRGNSLFVAGAGERKCLPGLCSWSFAGK